MEWGDCGGGWPNKQTNQILRATYRTKYKVSTGQGRKAAAMRSLATRHKVVEQDKTPRPWAVPSCERIAQYMKLLTMI